MNPSQSTVFRPKRFDLNLNTILLIAGFAALWWLSQYFVTKEIYYRDQMKIEQTFREIKDGQTQIINILTRESRDNRNSK